MFMVAILNWRIAGPVKPCRATQGNDFEWNCEHIQITNVVFVYGHMCKTFKKIAVTKKKFDRMILLDINVSEVNVFYPRRKSKIQWTS